MRPLSALVVVAFGALIALQCVAFAGCSWLKREASDAKTALVDCTKAESAKAVHELGPVMDVMVAQAVASDGKVDYAPLKQLAKDSTADVFGCVLASTVARGLKPAPLGFAGGLPFVDKQSLAVGFLALKAQIYGDRTFHTAAGDL